MTVNELMNLFMESANQEIEVWSLESNQALFSGFYGDMEDIIGEYEIESIDNLSHSSCLVINIA